MNPSRLGIYGAAGSFVGVVLSGPLAAAVVGATHPQPSWHGAELFAISYHPVQSLPYFGGIGLVVALVALVCSLHATASDRHRARTAMAVVFTAVFASFILFNYVVQTTFLPVLTRDYDPRNASIIAALAMGNPASLTWAIEMWGWAFLGVATWLVAPVFQGGGLERWTATTFAANGPLSLLGAFVTVMRPGWVMTSAGLAAFSLWNALLAAMAVLAFLVFRNRSAGEADAASMR